MLHEVEEISWITVRLSDSQGEICSMELTKLFCVPAGKRNTLVTVSTTSFNHHNLCSLFTWRSSIFYTILRLKRGCFRKLGTEILNIICTNFVFEVIKGKIMPES
jgi:hypothetical protein